MSSLTTTRNTNATTKPVKTLRLLFIALGIILFIIFGIQALSQARSAQAIGGNPDFFEVHSPWNFLKSGTMPSSSNVQDKRTLSTLPTASSAQKKASVNTQPSKQNTGASAEDNKQPLRSQAKTEKQLEIRAPSVRQVDKAQNKLTVPDL